MSAKLPKALEKLIHQLERLPGVGRRTAERYAYDLLRGSPQTTKDISEALNNLHQKVKYCPKTFALIDFEQDVSELYSDASRDKTILAVVAQPLDVIALESTGNYHGTYHVLKGLLSPIDGIGPEQLTINELITRIEEDSVKELILATSGSVEGQSTALYIKKLITDESIKITELARGLPVGLDIEFADQITLTQALADRRLLND